MSNNKNNLLFIKPVNSSFVNTDERILKTRYFVDSFELNQGKSNLKYFVRLINLAFFILRKGIKSKAIVTWFGDYHSFTIVLLSKVIRKPVVIIAGGQETVCYPELGKGVYLKPLRGWCVKYALRNASLILPNHKSLIYHENYFYNPKNPHIDGIKHYVKNVKARIEVVPNGIDTKRIIRDPSIKKETNLVLTVASVSKRIDFINKGFDLLIETARKNNDLEFVIIRISKELMEWVESEYEISKIKNLTVISEFCSDEKLSEYYNKAAIYVQVSITEGMPVSLGEAMLCECIPVGSNVNGIPDAIGGNGEIVNKRDVDELSSAISQALFRNSGSEARKYTLNNFSIEQREERLIKAIETIIL